MSRGEIEEMIELEPLIARLVTDVLGCLRAARLEEVLAALRGAESEGAIEVPVARAAVIPAESPRPSGRPPKVRASRPRVPSRTNTRPVVVAGGPKRAPAPTKGEITNPDGLLSMGRETPGPAPRPVEPADPSTSEKDAPPPRGEPGDVIRLSVRLREGETLARDSGAGVVIRRARTA